MNGSQTNLPEAPKSEEIDLGQVFKAIGDLFQRLFNFIASILKAIYKVLLLLLVHLYKRILWYVGVIILSFIIGYFVDKSKPTVYGANMFIETNFNSARQVYENIFQLQQLAFKDKDSLELASVLNISASDAAMLRGFYIEPDVDENKRVQMYSDYLITIDSASRADASYKDFVGNLTASSFGIHKIGVASTDKYIYKKISKRFVKVLQDNPYLDSLKQVELKNIEQQFKDIEKNKKVYDSLRKEYLAIRIKESNKTESLGSGTNLFMGSAQNNSVIVDEAAIFQKKMALENKKLALNKKRVVNQKVINVLSDFPKSGYEISVWTDKMKFVFPFIGITLLFLVFIFMGLGDFLKSQEALLLKKDN